MWYRIAKLTKEGGAENILQGSLPMKDTLYSTVSPYRYSSNIDQLPSFQSLIGFFQNDAITKLRLIVQKVKAGDISVWQTSSEFNSIESFMQKVIELYRSNPKYQHYVYPIYTELAKVIQIRRQIEPNYNGYFYNPKEHSADHSWWLADTLQIGYGSILNLEKLGLSMPPQFKMMILAGLDIKAKPDLANAHGRQEMIDYIKKNYPFYQRFEIKGQDDSGWLETIDQIFNQPEELKAELDASLLPSEKQAQNDSYDKASWVRNFLTEPMFKSGIPKSDLSRYMDYTTKHQVKVIPPSDFVEPQEPDPFEPEPPHIEKEKEKIQTQISLLESQISSFESKDAGKLMMLFLDISHTAPLKTQENIAAKILNKISSWEPRDCITIPQISQMMQHEVIRKIVEAQVQKYYESGQYQDGTFDTDIERLIKLGVAPDKVISKYVRSHPRSLGTIMVDFTTEDGNKKLAAWKKLADQGAKEEAEKEQKEKEEREKLYKKLEEERKQREQNEPKQAYSLLGKNIEKGNIVHGSLASIEGGRWLRKAQEIGQSMRLDPEVVNDWCNTVQVYIMVNGNFERDLRETKNPRYDTLSGFGEMYGLFTPSFSKDEIEAQRLPSIWLKQYQIILDHREIPLFQVLGVDPSISVEAVMGHEIAHALNFIATGGKILRSDEEDMSGDKGRDYLTSYPELMARIYGEIPLWRKEIHDKIDSMRNSTLIQKAVLSEITEQTLTHSAGAALGATDPIQEYARANQNLYPYYHTDNPVAAATKKVQRMEAKIAGMIKEDALKNRRQVLLNILKQINELKAQLVMIEKASVEFHEFDPSQAEQRRIKKEIDKLEYTKQQAMGGAFDLEIDTSINAVVDSFLMRYLKSISNAVNDPDWIPPQTWITEEGKDITPAFKPGSEPMNYYEIKNLSGFAQNMADNASGGAINQPRNFETVLPTTIPGYQDTYRNQVVPRYPELDQNNNILPPKTAASDQ